MAYVAPKIKWRKQNKYREDVIAVAKATGCVLQFWNSLLVGDDLTILSIVADEEYEYLMDSIYDTSNIEEWKNFRFNYRCLSTFSLFLFRNSDRSGYQKWTEMLLGCFFINSTRTQC